MIQVILFLLALCVAWLLMGPQIQSVKIPLTVVVGCGGIVWFWTIALDYAFEFDDA
jgi:hypothetical protein